MPRAASIPARSFLVPLAVSLAVAASASHARAEDGAWIPLDPGPRMSHTLTVDPGRARALQFGGWDGNGFTSPGAFHDDAWVLDLAGDPTWELLDPPGPTPAPRIEHVALLDTARDRLIVFGGKTSTVYYNDLWALDLTPGGAWTPVRAAGRPPAPLETRAILDPLRDRIVFFGGYRPRGGDLDELWELTLSGTPTWRPLAASGSPPPPRRAHTMIYDPVGDRIIVFGGLAGQEYLNDVWALSLSSDKPRWSELSPDGEVPDPRYGHAAVFDPRRDRMVVFGGYLHPTHQFMSDVWALDLAGPPAWASLDIGGPLPPPRDFAAMIYDPPHDRLVLQGGNTLVGIEGEEAVTEVLGDLWLVDVRDRPSAVRVAAEPEEVERHQIRLRWQVAAGRPYDVLRSEENGRWIPRGTLRPAGAGEVTWVDRAEPGTTYAYRLRWSEEGVERFGGSVRLSVPDGLARTMQAERRR